MYLPDTGMAIGTEWSYTWQAVYISSTIDSQFLGLLFRYEGCGVHIVNYCDLLVRYTIPVVPAMRL